MSWLKKAIPPKIKNILGKVKRNIPEGLWQKCPSCQTVLYGTDLEKNNYVCPNCDFHHRINARKRISLLLDTPDQIELGKDIKPTDPLSFKDSKPYKDRIKSSQKQTNENDALITFKGHLESLDVVMNRLHRNGALWAPRLCESNPEIIMEASESFYPDPAYV